MTNQELIDKLQKLPPGAPVYMYNVGAGIDGAQWLTPIAATVESGDLSITIEVE